MEVSDLMTRDPLRIAPDAGLDAALELMDDHDVRHLVVSKGETVLGVLSDRDLLQATGWMNAAARARRPQEGEAPQLVADIAHAHPVTISPEDSVVSAAVELSGRAIGCLPVMSEGVLVGILSELDLVEAYRGRVEESEAAGSLDPSVDSLMRRSVTTTGPDTTLAQARDLCRSLDVRHLPVVVGEDQLVGMLSDRDLRRAQGQGRAADTPVEELMSRDLVIIGPNEGVRRAAELVLISKVSSLAVVNDGRLVGLLTVTDLVDHCMESLRETDS